jgi:uncharacterized membrane protein YozB (DUF420 family)
MDLYTVVLSLHNLVRWVVIILAILAFVRAYLGWLGSRPWTEQDRRIGSFFAMSVDVQLLLGLLLYFFLSPLTRQALQDFGAAMSNPGLRFFGLEHIFYMIVAVILVHLGSVFSRRAKPDTSKHRIAAILYTLAVVVILVGIPWDRPLLRLG